MCRETQPLGAILCFLILITCQTSANADQSADECTLSMGWEPWHPYQFIDPNGTVTGFDVELVEAVGTLIGCGITHREVNWARGLVDVENGNLDLIASANFTHERSVWAQYTDSYRDSSIVIFMRKGESALYPLDSLLDISGTDFRLGVGRGVKYSDEVTEFSKDPEFRKRLVYVPTSELQQYQMLQASRIDGFLRSITALKSLRELVGKDINLEVHPLKIGGAKQHVILSKKSVPAELYKRFNEGLRTVMSNGKLESLLAKYFKQ